MRGTIFIEQLKQGWMTALYFGIGLASLCFVILSAVQDSTVLEQYEQIIGQMPPMVMRAFGLSDASFLASPEGFLAFGGLGYGVLILAVFAVLSGLNITANDEDDGIMDVVLALPIPRWQVIVEKFLAYVVLLVGIVVLMSIGIIVGRFVMGPGFELDLAKVIVAAFNLVPGVLLIMAVTVALSGLIVQKRIVTILATVFVMASYFLNMIGGATSSEIAQTLNNFSVFKYIDTEGSVMRGVDPINIGLLLGLTLVCVFISTIAFERRDIGQ